MPHDHLHWLYNPLSNLPEFNQLSDALSNEGVFSAYGMDDAQRLHLCAGLSRKLRRPLLFVVPNDQAAQRALEDLNTLFDGGAALLPGREIRDRKSVV